ncbi:MAG: hypothetical protein AB7F89_17850 [Pirellulaceae bacterium]
MVAAIGCSGAAPSNLPKTYPVSGTVTMGGKPVEGATVNFMPMSGSGSSIGLTDKDGNYNLSTYSSNDGAEAGQYKVSVVKWEGDTAPSNVPPAGTIASGEIDESTYAPPSERATSGSVGSTGPKNLLPSKYANGDTSALRATVTEGGPNKFDFDLK